MFFLPVKIRTNSYMTYFMENVVIADKLHCGSEHDHFDSDEDIMPATLSITSGQEETG
jgi:hypothetical protein